MRFSFFSVRLPWASGPTFEPARASIVSAPTVAPSISSTRTTTVRTAPERAVERRSPLLRNSGKGLFRALSLTVSAVPTATASTPLQR